MNGAKRVEQDNDRLARDTENFRDGDGRTEKPQLGIGRSIHPGVTVPTTVLVAVMTDSSYLLLGHPQGEPAFSIARDRL